MAKVLREFLFSLVLKYNYGVWEGLNYFKIVNFDSRTYCNTFWMISATSEISTKSGPSDPVSITKTFQKIPEIWGHPWQILFISENLKLWFLFVKVCAPQFCICLFWMFESRHVTFLILTICKFWKSRIGHCQIDIFQIDNFQIENW